MINTKNFISRFIKFKFNIFLISKIEPPTEPINLLLRSVGNGEISLSWMSPEQTGNSPITEYIIERCEIKHDETDGEFKWIVHDIVDRYTLDYKLKNLAIGGNYLIRVAARNSAGNGKYAEMREHIIARNMYSVPDSPTGPVIFTNMTRETVDATWHEPKHNGGSPLLSYFIEKRDLSETIWIKVARIDAEVKTLKIINLVEGHDYLLRVSAENEYGKSIPLQSSKFRPLRLYGI